MNKFIGIGRLTKDIELKQTNNGNSFISNSIAIKNDFKSANGNYDSEFVNIQVWGKTAEYMAQYSRKGMMIAVEGRMTTRSYDDNEGNKRYVTEIVCNSVELLEYGKKENTQQEEHQSDPYEDFGNSVELDDNFLD